MALVTIPNRDKKLIIWNFMEELWENYQNALENKLDTRFKFMDFYNVGLLSQYLRETGVDGLPDKIVVDTLKIMERNQAILESKVIWLSLLKKDWKNVKNLNANGISVCRLNR